MNRQSRIRSLVMALVALIVFCGAFVVARRYHAPPPAHDAEPRPDRPVATSGASVRPLTGAGEALAPEVAALRERNLLVLQKSLEQANRIGPSTHAGDAHVGKPARLSDDLLARFTADHRLKITHHRGVRVRP